MDLRLVQVLVDLSRTVSILTLNIAFLLLDQNFLSRDRRVSLVVVRKVSRDELFDIVAGHAVAEVFNLDAYVLGTVPH